jgi:hypothetical protein
MIYKFWLAVVIAVTVRPLVYDNVNYLLTCCGVAVIIFVIGVLIEKIRKV